MKNFSAAAMNRDFSAFFGQVFGDALGGNLLPWQRGMIGQSVMPQPGKGLAQEISERIAQMHRDLQNIGWVSRTPKRPWAYWQFKNGKLAACTMVDIDWNDPKLYLAYDRSLGCDVLYQG